MKTHAFADGCPSNCSTHGVCVKEGNEYRCSCNTGWKGDRCHIEIENNCMDGIDNDGGKLHMERIHIFSIMNGWKQAGLFLKTLTVFL